MWFSNLIETDNPGKKELEMFVNDIQHFLITVLEDQKFTFIWKHHPDLHDLALETYRYDIAEGAIQQLLSEIPKITETKIQKHGLEGRPLKFKFHVINTVANQLNSAKRHFSVRSSFKKLIDAIDALLDSLIEAAGGAGGMIKEFKDSIGSLA